MREDGQADQPRTRRRAVLKVLYLLAVTAAVFAVPAVAARWVVVPALLSLQVILLLAYRLGPSEIHRSAWRLKWLFLFLALCYGLLPAEGGARRLRRRVGPRHGLVGAGQRRRPGAGRPDGGQILTVVLASVVVRGTGPATTWPTACGPSACTPCSFTPSAASW